MNEEDELISPLEYRPVFTRPERDRTAWENTATDAPIGDDVVADIGTGVVTDVIKDYEDVKAQLDEKIKEREKELKKDTIPVPDIYLDDVARAKADLGLPDGPLTLLDYKAALLQPDTPAGDFLLNLVEQQAEDVDGDIRLETYGDYVELRDELDLIDTYIDRFLYPVLKFQRDDPTDWAKELENKELAWHDTQTKRNKAYTEAKTAYKRSYLYQRESALQARAQLHTAEKDKDRARHERQRVQNTATVVAQKARAVRWLVSELEELDTYAPDIQASASELLELAEDDKEAGQALTDARLYLKLAVDSHNKDKGQHKHLLRNAYGKNKQTKILDEYSLQSKAFDDKGLNLTHYMRAFQHQLSPVTEGILNEMVKGLGENARNMKEKTYEFYTLQQAASNLRQRKIEETRQKHLARLGYQGFGDRIKQIQTGEE